MEEVRDGVGVVLVRVGAEVQTGVGGDGGCDGVSSMLN